MVAAMMKAISVRLVVCAMAIKVPKLQRSIQKQANRSPYIHPRQQTWSEHFHWSADGAYVMGKTGCCRATIDAVQLNNPYALTVRQAWVSVGWHPPDDE
jgi:hypothetical protein